jgi:hypothetical protein
MEQSRMEEIKKEISRIMARMNAQELAMLYSLARQLDIRHAGKECKK